MAGSGRGRHLRAVAAARWHRGAADSVRRTRPRPATRGPPPLGRVVAPHFRDRAARVSPMRPHNAHSRLHHRAQGDRPHPRSLTHRASELATRTAQTPSQRLDSSTPRDILGRKESKFLCRSTAGRSLSLFLRLLNFICQRGPQVGDRSKSVEPEGSAEAKQQRGERDTAEA